MLVNFHALIPFIVSYWSLLIETYSFSKLIIVAHVLLSFTKNQRIYLITMLHQRPLTRAWSVSCVPGGPGGRGDYTGCGSVLVLAKLCRLQPGRQQPTVARDQRGATQRRFHENSARDTGPCTSSATSDTDNTWVRLCVSVRSEGVLCSICSDQ